ncbi:hypothetical protein M404DRAFT_998965 [Pisolithus tinctorius Marx 270]|uniref:Uncharacterized protein n=1 Tax=Pisolithus tinctorius Marx 270 TaxID=870435 RepID=A0A0C3K9S9_PISTI|nr:hypothetical protein M404DRAFT_998965 [Pisolithus tinctorius Marx 270]
MEIPFASLHPRSPRASLVDTAILLDHLKFSLQVAIGNKSAWWNDGCIPSSKIAMFDSNFGRTCHLDLACPFLSSFRISVSNSHRAPLVTGTGLQLPIKFTGPIQTCLAASALSVPLHQS